MQLARKLWSRNDFDGRDRDHVEDGCVVAELLPAIINARVWRGGEY